MTKAPLIAILVEDSRTIRDTLVPALRELGHTQVVAWATTSKEAANALAAWHGQWELIIVDLFLAAGSGLDVLKQVQAREPGQHAIVLSNYATDEMRRQCTELGADGIFDKSTEIDLFLDRCISIGEMR
ncbi:response regulator [Acidovorax sp.]|jgi:DNA-binding NarL/FixJ family response regulator|uniref:response regulator n=1 Tax=Acidovorax sp. TaxID=1872122 RepID=UPI00391F78A8